MSLVRKLHNVRSWLCWAFGGHPLLQARHDYENAFLKSHREITELLPMPLAEASVLVLGCGYNYAEVILYSHVSKHVVGLDVIGAFYRDGVFQRVAYLRTSGASQLKASIQPYLEWHRYCRYYHYLAEACGVPIHHEQYALQSYDGGRMPFDDETFDVVLSNAVLEHVGDVESLFREVSRVTRAQGVSYHVWHNYYSFSGCHAPESLRLKHPWGHLRGKFETPGLNKITPNEVEDHFVRYFGSTALHQVDKSLRKRRRNSDFQYERSDLLSESIRRELESFPIELLLTRGYLITGRKAQHAGMQDNGSETPSAHTIHEASTP